jgi:hypothetical protein
MDLNRGADHRLGQFSMKFWHASSLGKQFASGFPPIFDGSANTVAKTATS